MVKNYTKRQIVAKENNVMIKLIDPINKELRDCKNKWDNEDYFFIMNLTKQIYDRLQEIKSR